jgi:hypothetical protein
MDRYLVALDLLNTHGGSRTSAWEVAGDLLAEAPIEDVFTLVATESVDQRLRAADAG